MDVTNTNNEGKTASSESPLANKVILSADEALEFELQLHRDGSLDQAEIFYRKVIATAPEDLNALHYIGVFCHQQKRHAEAAKSIERIIVLDPENADAHNNLGNVLKGLGKYPGCGAGPSFAVPS